MKVLHLSPTYFDSTSVIGGGERYALELARAMSETEDVCFFSFSDEKLYAKKGKLEKQYVRSPFSLTFLKRILWADVIHCHQVHYFSIDLAIIIGKLFGKKVYVTDLGGGEKFTLSYHLPLLKWVDALLLISEYSKKLWQEESREIRPKSLEVIYGGVDVKKFCPDESKKEKRVLYAGRLLAHKGIDYLIEALPEDLPLDIVGRVYDQKYFDLLKEKSQGKQVSFYTETSDEELIQFYRKAMVTVQPSVYKNCFGEESKVPELLGLVSLESMACGTPVIVTEVASLPEIISEANTGWSVEPNNSSQIEERINYLRDHFESLSLLEKNSVAWVGENFTWPKVVERCLFIYKKDMKK